MVRSPSGMHARWGGQWGESAPKPGEEEPTFYRSVDSKSSLISESGLPAIPISRLLLRGAGAALTGMTRKHRGRGENRSSLVVGTQPTCLAGRQAKIQNLPDTSATQVTVALRGRLSVPPGLPVKLWKSTIQPPNSK